jgi:alpha-1,6-mannosyltransferase
VFAWLLCLSSVYLFWRGYRIVNSNDESLAHLVVAFGAIFCLIGLFIYPFHSTDVFGYINRGWQQVHYHQNPYVNSTAQIPNWQQDPMIAEHWIYNPNPYGFLFTLLARGLAFAGGGHHYFTLLLFKGVNALAYGATSWLIWNAAKRLGRSRPVTDLYLFMWNPLVLLHHIANGHNDILTGYFVALAMYFAVVGAGFWIIPMLALATLLKYGPAILLPFAIIYVIKNFGWKTAILSSLLATAIGVAVSAPFLIDWKVIRLEDIRDNATLIDNSLHSFLIHIFENAARLLQSLSAYHGLVDAVIKNVLRLGLVMFFIAQLVTIPKDFKPTDLIRKSLLVMFVLICVASSKFNAWYMGMLLPIALLMDAKYWLRRVVVLITVAETFSLTFFKQAYILNVFAMMLLPGWIVYRQVKRERRGFRATVV